MSAAVYRRRLVLFGALVFAFMIMAPLTVFGGSHLACRGSPGEGCGDISIVFIFFIALPIFVALLLWIIWTAVRRLQWLKLPRWFTVFVCLIIIGNIRVVLLAPDLFAPGGTPREPATTLFPSVFIVVALLLIPEPTDRRPVAPFLPGILCLLGILQLARLAPVILYPMWLVPGGLQMSYAIRGVSYWGPLGLLPGIVPTLAFVAVSLTMILQWRQSRA